MYYKILISFLILLTSNMLTAKNYMMNCTSPDFKSSAFYKFNSIDEKLFIRPVKQKWKDFCEVYVQNEDRVSCSFNKSNFIRSSINKKDNNILEKIYEINFVEYALIETVKLYKNNSLKDETNTVFKCRKIKI